MRVTALAVALLLGPVAHPVLHARTAGPPLRILWIGNSYTFVNDLPKVIAQLADSSHVDRNPEVTGILEGGELLKGHWANPALQEALAPVGLPAIGVTHEEARRAQSAAHKALAENR